MRQTSYLLYKGNSTVLSDTAVAGFHKFWSLCRLTSFRKENRCSQRKFSIRLSTTSNVAPSPSIIGSGTKLPASSLSPFGKRSSKAYVLTAVIVSFGITAIAYEPASFSALRWSLYARAAIRTGAQGAMRSMRTFGTSAVIFSDYKISMRSLQRGTEEYKRQKLLLYQRTADRILHLALVQGGIFTKLGQTLASMNATFPAEFTSTLGVLQDKAPFVSFEVQYPKLATQLSGDLWALRIVQFAASLYDPEFPSILPDFEKNLLSELDFKLEKKNSQRVKRMFDSSTAGFTAVTDQQQIPIRRAPPKVYVPEVYGEFSSQKVLTMEFIDGVKVNDLKALQAIGVPPEDVSELLVKAFAEMIFCHGFVHCDPHPGNVMVRRVKSNSNQDMTQLVVLDHGLYVQLDEKFRTNFCLLWKAMLSADKSLLMKASEGLGLQAYTTYLPLIFTYRMVDGKTPLGAKMLPEDREKLQQQLKHLDAGDIKAFINSMGNEMFLLFRINSLIRSVNKDLGGSASSFDGHNRTRFGLFGEAAIKGLHMRRSEKDNEFHLQSMGWQTSIRYRWSLMQIKTTAFLMDAALRLRGWWKGIEMEPQRHLG